MTETSGVIKLALADLAPGQIHGMLLIDLVDAWCDIEEAHPAAPGGIAAHRALHRIAERHAPTATAPFAYCSSGTHGRRDVLWPCLDYREAATAMGYDLP